MKAVILTMIASLGCANCANYKESRAVARFGGYVMIVGAPPLVVGGGILIAKAGGEGIGFIAFGLDVVGLVIFGTGLLTGSLGLVGMGFYDKSPPPPKPEVFCTTSPVASSVCFCSVRRTECETRRGAIEAGGGTMSACVVEARDRCR